MASKKSSSDQSGDGEEESDDWEDVDCDDGEMEVLDEVASEEEDSADMPSREESKANSSGFVIIGEQSQPSVNDFSVIDSKNKESEASKTESYHVIGDSASSIAEDAKGPKSHTSYSSALHNVINGQRKGKTRREAFQNLDIKQAELLSTGEIKLPNGKIIGHRDYRHIYRQRTKLPDAREAVVINKLALEYRRMRQEENGVVANVRNAVGFRHLDQQQLDENKNGGARHKHLLKKDKDHMQIGVKNSKTMMTHFRLQYNM